MSSVDLITLGLLALQAGFVLMMVVYLVSGLDDLFVDLLFFMKKAAQWLHGQFKGSPAKSRRDGGDARAAICVDVPRLAGS